MAKIIIENNEKKLKIEAEVSSAIASRIMKEVLEYETEKPVFWGRRPKNLAFLEKPEEPEKPEAPEEPTEKLPEPSKPAKRWIPKKRGPYSVSKHREEIITEKLLEYQRKGRSTLKLARLIKACGFKSGGTNAFARRTAVKHGFKVTQFKKKGRPYIIFFKKQEPGAEIREFREVYGGRTRRIRKVLSNLIESGRKEIQYSELIKTCGIHTCGEVYRLLDKITSGMNLEVVKKGIGRSCRKKVILEKKPWKGKIIIEESHTYNKIKEMIRDLKISGIKTVSQREIAFKVSTAKHPSRFVYKEIAKAVSDLGLEMIRAKAKQGCPGTIVLQKELYSRKDYKSVYAIVMQKWETVPTPFTVKQAVFKLFGWLKSQNYNMAAMNVHAALGNLVKQGKLTRKKISGLVKARGGKEIQKQIWLYDLPKPGEPSEPEPEPAPVKLDIPILGESTIIRLFDSHTQISPMTFTELENKYGESVSERQSRYLFHWIIDNIGYIQGLTGKKITVSGYGTGRFIRIDS